ncbi:MAG: methionine adenosyltransferase [Haloferacaceae archaeon]|nr:methionine adenosyltransferase [Haloferacaceae archaeon]
MTDRNIAIESLDRVAPEDQKVEIVERKGLGHPDSICDGIAESVSRALSQLYLDRVGSVLHYNTDETQLVAGESAPAFAGGEILNPIYVLIVGRATKTYDGMRLPVDATAIAAAGAYIAQTVPELTVGEDIIIDVKFGQGSGDLTDVFGDGDAQIPMANDTSYGVGFAPLTETEAIVKATEESLTGAFADEQPAVGPDIKVMGKREEDAISITVAVAMIDRFVDDLPQYQEIKQAVRQHIETLAADHTDREVQVAVNTADDYETESVYLTVSGTSAEMGDDGSVGRGNRSNGLITPNRPMSMEATSGKNPVNHIGKIYNLLSTEIAETVVAEVPAVEEVQVRLVSQIGSPIDRPHLADVQLLGPAADTAVQSAVEAIVDQKLQEVTAVTRRCIEGDVTTF